LRLSAAIAIGASVAVLAAGQDQQQTPPPQPPPPVPTFRAEANYVRVDVYPTVDGAPVTDLRLEDFEVSEDRVLQKVEQFERVVIAGGAGQPGRPEPNTVEESRRAVQDPRARVFVLFLDLKHVEGDASRTIARPLVKALNTLIGPDDYVAAMTPGMSARDITFARRRTSIEGLLSREWWGERDRVNFSDPVENQYAQCYPGIPKSDQFEAPDKGVAQEMILRRREKQTLDALEDLSRFLRDVREERKAVITITDGWLLYGPNRNLARPLENIGAPPVPGINIDPRNGKLTNKDTVNKTDNTLASCESDRYVLSELNNDQRMRTIFDEANRANVSFYPVDPRGLAVFDEQIVPTAGVGSGIFANPTLSPEADRARLVGRSTSLRSLAEATDGLAIVGTNNIENGFKRIINDMSAYYLLGYYSTGKLDGRFHSIRVRVKRPGVEVRARRGYLAPSAADAARGLPKAPTPGAPGAENAIATAAAAAVATLPAAARDQPLRVHVTAGWRPGGEGSGGQPKAGFWTVTEVADRIPGSEIEALLTHRGEVVGSARGRITPGAVSLLMPMEATVRLDAGDYEVRVRSQTPGGVETLTVPVTLPPPSSASGAVYMRRGPSSGNKDLPTADLRYRRSDRLHVEVPSAAAMATARLLDRTGKPFPVPVASTMRDDADGSRWASAEVALAPLAPGDYLVEVSADAMRTLVPFRLVP
jgi:VWFA-related protein